MDIVDFFQTFDNSKIFNIFSEGMEVYNSVQSCSIQASFTDISTFCTVHPNSCTSASLMENVTKNMFVLMGKFTEITSIVQEFPAETATDLYTQTSNLGNILGTTLRLLSGFQPWSLNS